jgi:hypothetical protein
MTVSGFTKQSFTDSYHEAYTIVLVNELGCSTSQVTIQVNNNERRRLGTAPSAADAAPSSIDIRFTVRGLSEAKAEEIHQRITTMQTNGGEGFSKAFKKEMSANFLVVPKGYAVAVDAEPEEEGSVVSMPMVGAILGATIIVLLLVLAFRRFSSQRRAASVSDLAIPPPTTPLTSTALVTSNDDLPMSTPKPSSRGHSLSPFSPKAVKCPGVVPTTVTAGMSVLAETKTGFFAAVIIRAKKPTPHTPGGVGPDSLWIVQFTDGPNAGEELGRKQSRLRTIVMREPNRDEEMAQRAKQDELQHPPSSGCLESCFWATIGAGVSKEERHKMYSQQHRNSIDEILQTRLDGKTHTGHGFWFDLVFYLQNDDAVWGMFAANQSHPYTRRERKFVCLSMVFIGMFLCVGMLPPTNCASFAFIKITTDAHIAAYNAEHYFPNLDLFGFKQSACDASPDASAQTNLGALLVGGLIVICGGLLTQMAFCFCLAQYDGGIKAKTANLGVMMLTVAVCMSALLGGVAIAAIALAEPTQQMALGYFCLKGLAAAFVIGLTKELLTFFALYTFEMCHHRTLDEPQLSAYDNEKSHAHLRGNEMFHKMHQENRDARRTQSVSPPRLIHGSLL